MKKRWALVTVVVALALGAAASTFLMRSMREPLRLSLTCMLLNEAEKARHLNREQRRVLIEKLASAPTLNAADRTLVPRLKSVCSEWFR